MRKILVLLVVAFILVLSGCGEEILPEDIVLEEEILSSEPEPESEQEPEPEKRMFENDFELLMYQVELYERAYYGFPMDTDYEYSGVWKVAAAYMNDIDTAGKQFDRNAEARLFCERWLGFYPSWENLHDKIEPLETVITVKESEIGEESARIVVSRNFKGEELFDCEYVFAKVKADGEILESVAEPLTVDGYYWKYESVTPIIEEYQGEAFVIITAEELIDVCEKINAREPSYISGKFVLGNDIDMTGYDWQPIGIMMDYSADINNLLYAKVNTGFNGEFDGAGYKISGLNVTEYRGGKCLGFFGAIGPFAYVHDLTVEGNITNESSEHCFAAGGFAGIIYHGAKVENCHFTGTVKGDIYTGGFAGLVGYAPYSTGEHYLSEASVTGCSANAEIYANQSCGGFAGEIYNGVSSCDTVGTLNIINKKWRPNVIGGFVGGLMCDIENCRSAVTINYDVDAPDWMGNFAGELVWEIKIENCKVDTDNLHEGWRLIGMQHYKNCEINIAKEDWHS